MWMKKIRNLLLLLVVIPICLSFSACKKDKNNDNKGDGGQGQVPDSPTQVYSVHFDYNLPDDYEYLLSDRVISDKILGSTTALLSVPNSKLRTWFLGWSYQGNSEILNSNSTVSSNVSTTIELKGNWDEENLRKYYYTDNLTFELDEINKKAVVSGCSASGSMVIIPELYTSGIIEVENGNVKNETYEVTGIKNEVFLDKIVGKIVLNAKNISIGDSAFKGSNISALNFENVAEVGINSFEGTSIQSIKFGSGLTKIGDGAFKDCKSLQSVDFASASVDVSANAFYDDNLLDTIKNAENLSKIGNCGFYGCSSLTSVNFFGNGITELGNEVFKACSNITSVVIPKNVTVVGVNLFVGCSKLQSLSISRLYTSATHINGDRLTTVFGNIASSLTSLTLQDNIINKLTANYLYGLENLTTLVMCDSIEEIEDGAFYSCTELKNITFSNNIDVKKFSISVFEGTRFLSELTSPLIYKKSLLYVPENIDENYNFTDENGEEIDVELICDDAFRGNEALKSISFPNTITFIGEGAFENCSNLETVSFSTDSILTSLSKRVFKNCKKLATINIQNLTQLTTINNQAFYGTAISSITIPSSVENIASDAFAYSQKMTKFELSGTSSNIVVIDDVLYEKLSGNKLKLICYPASKDENLFVCPENVTVIGSRAFVNAKNLDAIIFDESSSISWETTGNVVYAFDGAIGIVILSKNTSLICNSQSVATYYFTSDCEYNSSDNTISLNDGFSLIEGKTKYYTQYTDTENNKVSFVCFKVSESGDEKTTTFVKIIDTNLQG